MNNIATHSSAAADSDLMAKAAGGDRKAFELLYERYAGPLYGYFCKMLWNDSALAQDQVQEVFLKLIQKPELYDPTRNFKTWIYSMAHNMCKNQYRHKAVKDSAKEYMEASSASKAETHQSMDHQTFKAALNEALDKLDPEKKEAFILRYKQELNIREIAEITNTPEGTVKSRLFYTLRELAEALKVFNPNLST